MGILLLASISQKSFWVRAMTSPFWLLVKRGRTRWRSLHSTDSQFKFSLYLNPCIGLLVICNGYFEFLWFTVGIFVLSENFLGNCECWRPDVVGGPGGRWEGCRRGGIWCCVGQQWEGLGYCEVCTLLWLSKINLESCNYGIALLLEAGIFWWALCLLEVNGH